MRSFTEYSPLYPNIHMSRSEGIISVRLHTNEGPLKWGATAQSIHAQLGHAFRDIALDGDNRAMIFTGTGSVFCVEMAPDELPGTDAENWSRLMREGNDLLLNFLDINIPVVSVLNGPACIHAELAVMGDVVLATDDAYVQDAAHVLGGVVPGDGVQTVWMDLLGPNRGRHFLLMGTQINSEQLLQSGVAAEVLPRENILARATEIATQLATIPPITARYTRTVLTQRMKKRLTEELQLGLAVEGLSIAALIESSAPDN